MRDQFSKSNKGTQTTWNTPVDKCESFKESIMVDKGVQTVSFVNLSPIHSPRIRTLQTFDEEDDFKQDINDENSTNYKEKESKQPVHQTSLFYQRMPRKKVAINYKGNALLHYSTLTHTLTYTLHLTY